VENTLKRYCNDLHAVIQYITEPKQLKEAVKALYQKHVLEPPQGAQVDVDIQKEYNRQRDYLEKTVDSLKRKLSKYFIFYFFIFFEKTVDSLKRKLSKYAQILLLICTHAPVSSSSYEHTHSCP
jgi:hypothetical protein